MPAKSEKQRRLFGAALSYKLGKTKDVSDEVKKIADSMSVKKIKEFLKTESQDDTSKTPTTKGKKKQILMDEETGSASSGAYEAPMGTPVMRKNVKESRAAVSTPVEIKNDVSLNQRNNMNGSAHPKANKYYKDGEKNPDRWGGMEDLDYDYITDDDKKRFTEYITRNEWKKKNGVTGEDYGDKMIQNAKERAAKVDKDRKKIYVLGQNLDLDPDQSNIKKTNLAFENTVVYRTNKVLDESFLINYGTIMPANLLSCARLQVESAGKNFLITRSGKSRTIKMIK